MKMAPVSRFFLPFAALLLFGCVLKETATEKAPALVVRVVDGDTIIIDGGESVRLIGINSAERQKECYTEAKQKLADLVDGKIVFLEKDAENRDKYGRLLRYVYLGNNFVNLEMVETGYAYAYEYPPSVKFAEKIAKAEEKAQAGHEGCLWENKEANNYGKEPN